METRLSRQLLNDRLKDAVGLNYMSLAAIIAGVNLAAAADSLTRLLAMPGFPWDRLLLWICGCESIIIAYSALTLVPILATYKPNWRDHFFPLMIGLTVLLPFEVLPNPDLVVMWYFCTALTGLSRVGIARHVAINLSQVGIEDDAKEAVRNYARAMRLAAWSHLAVVAYFLVISCALFLIPGLRSWHWVFGGIGAVVLLSTIFFLERTRGRFVEALG